MRINHQLVFSTAANLRLGGLTPEKCEALLWGIKHLHGLIEKQPQQFRLEPAYSMFRDLGVNGPTENEIRKLWNEIDQRTKASLRKCWHPEASVGNCTHGSENGIYISAAHSIQRAKVLERIAEDHNVSNFAYIFQKAYRPIPIRRASTFYGFCNDHDRIFSPIERCSYRSTLEQNFLFAFRAFVHASHFKMADDVVFDFGKQTMTDIDRNLAVFNSGIASRDYSGLCTDTIVLPYEYPLAVASCSDLEFDFDGNTISHSKERMEHFFLTVFPDEGKTIVLFSYFEEDYKLYGSIIPQIKSRRQIESDLSVLIAGHCHNTYFSPSYFQKFIEPQSESIRLLNYHTQNDIEWFDERMRVISSHSITPWSYLDNQLNIQLFHKI